MARDAGKIGWDKYLSGEPGRDATKTYPSYEVNMDGVNFIVSINPTRGGTVIVGNVHPAP